MKSLKQWKITPSHLGYGIWGLTITGAIGSMGLSAIMGYLPCDLCWYQRAMMFPLPFVAGAAVYLRDSKLAYYVLPLSLTGALIAAYHLLLQYGVISESAVQCSLTGVSCAERYLDIWGFITIPFLSLVTFAAISVLAALHYRLSRSK